MREGTGQLVLREIEDRDLSVLFEHSTDPDAIRSMLLLEDIYLFFVMFSSMVVAFTGIRLLRLRLCLRGLGGGRRRSASTASSAPLTFGGDVNTVLQSPRTVMPPRTLEEARNQPGRREQIQAIVQRIESEGMLFGIMLAQKDALPRKKTGP